VPWSPTSSSKLDVIGYDCELLCKYRVHVVTETNPGVVSADDDFGQRRIGADLE
jgi:hypothetical protein